MFLRQQPCRGFRIGRVIETAVTSEGERLECGRFYRGLEAKIAQAQRRGHKRQAKRLHRKAARRRADALHKFSREIVDQYEYIVVGDVSSLKLAKTRMAKSVLDSGWGMLKRMLQYKGAHAGRSGHSFELQRRAASALQHEAQCFAAPAS
jgi:putative transposase